MKDMIIFIEFMRGDNSDLELLKTTGGEGIFMDTYRFGYFKVHPG